MPMIHSIPFRSELHAISLIDFARQSVRAVAQAIGVPKSTLHDNLSKYRANIDSFCEWQQRGELRLVRDVLTLCFEGKTSSRDCAKIVSRQHEQSVCHQAVLGILQEVATIARSKNNALFNLRKIDKSVATPGLPLSCITSAAFDEIFQKQQPILGLVDPVSAFVYFEAAQDRSEESWNHFLKNMKSLGLEPDSVITDGAMGLLKALKAAFPDANLFRDPFHVLQKTSKAVKVFEGKCYGLMISHERAVKNSLASQELSALKLRMDKAIETFDLFETKVKTLQKAFYFEHNDGYISSNDLKAIIHHTVNLLENAENQGIKHDVIHSAKTYLQRACSHIIAYKAAIEQMVTSQFGALHANMVLSYICPIIECLDQVQRSYENTKKASFWAKKVVEARARFRRLDFIDQQEVDRVIDHTAQIMTSVRKSNSLIEAVNSVIRRHLVTYKSIPSWFCPIFTFYWNHRTFLRGKRKGLKPREILTGQDFEKDWLDVLLEDYPFAASKARKTTQAKLAKAVA
jgi:hypothetical protein